MAKLLFRMRHVPDDEAQEVRELLDQNEIGYFETFAGNWGISMPALWLKDDAQYDKARQILDSYQVNRQTRVQSEYKLSQERGEVRTSFQVFLENPVRFVTYITLIGVVLFLSLRFFLSF